MTTTINASTTAGLVQTADTSGVLALQTAGTTAVTVDASQNVGIGTASPANKLHVFGTEVRVQQNASYYSLFDTAGTRYGYIQGGSGYLDIVSETGSANTIRFTTNGSERMRIDSSGNLSLGTTTSSGKFTILDNSGGAGVALPIVVTNGVDANFYLALTGSTATDKRAYIGPSTATALAFQTNATERMRISSAGLVLINATSTNYGEQFKISFPNTQGIHLNESTSSSSVNYQYFTKGATPTNVGAIFYNGSVMAYQTTSDYRLKENITPMTGALAKIAALKPVTYTWKDNQRDGEGFIAHELQEHFPDAVSGIKDDVDENGNPKYQGMDASILIATLTAALQEQQALITQLQADVAALKGA